MLECPDQAVKLFCVFNVVVVVVIPDLSKQRLTM